MKFGEELKIGAPSRVHVCVTLFTCKYIRIKSLSISLLSIPLSLSPSSSFSFSLSLSFLFLSLFSLFLCPTITSLDSRPARLLSPKSWVERISCRICNVSQKEVSTQTQQTELLSQCVIFCNVGVTIFSSSRIIVTARSTRGQPLEYSTEHARFYVYVDTKSGLSAAEIRNKLQNIFPDNCPSFSTILLWCRDFKSGKGRASTLVIAVDVLEQVAL